MTSQEHNASVFKRSLCLEEVVYNHVRANARAHMYVWNGKLNRELRYIHVADFRLTHTIEGTIDVNSIWCCGARDNSHFKLHFDLRIFYFMSIGHYIYILLGYIMQHYLVSFLLLLPPTGVKNMSLEWHYSFLVPLFSFLIDFILQEIHILKSA